MAEKLSEYIIPIGVLILGYSVMSNLGLVSSIGQKPAAISTNISPECPRGQKYNTEIWRDCEPGYAGERTSWLPFAPQSCVCLGKIPETTVTRETPAIPTPVVTPTPGILGSIFDYISSAAAESYNDLFGSGSGDFSAGGGTGGGGGAGARTDGGSGAGFGSDFIISPVSPVSPGFGGGAGFGGGGAGARTGNDFFATYTPTFPSTTASAASTNPTQTYYSPDSGGSSTLHARMGVP